MFGLNISYPKKETFIDEINNVFSNKNPGNT
jgi:hypothetical protein